MMNGCRGLRWLRLGIAALWALMIAVPGLSEARDKRDLVVMSQNLYLGSSLLPAIEATTPTDFLVGVATIHATAQATDFPARAKMIADEIAAKDPDVIGLQEATIWTLVEQGTTHIQDFLAILTDELAQRGLSYSVEAVSNNVSLGPIPLLFPCSSPGTCFVWYEDRDVILVKNNAALEILNEQNGRYDTQAVYTTPVGPISLERGWVYVDGTFDGKRFRFVNTHLEVKESPEAQEAQALEFLAGPAKATGSAVIAVGDFNSAADGSNTTSYALLTKSYFDDAWNTNPGDPGYTCCQDNTLSTLNSLLSERIDFVLSHGAARAQDAQRIGDEPILGAAPPYWPSDHAGVVSTIRIH